MAMVCPQCSQMFEGAERVCTRCKIQLLVHHRAKIGSPDEIPGGPESWQQNLWSRLVVSLLLAQGLAFCMQLASSAWMAGDSATSWNTPLGLTTLHCFHAISLILAGMLVGANQEHGILAGTLLGLLNGAIFVVVHRTSRDLLPMPIFLLQPLVHGFFGGLGGTFGYRIWRPIALFSIDDDSGTPIIPLRNASTLFRGPIHPVRITIGAIVSLSGLIFARQLFDVAVQSAGGGFKVDTHLQEHLIRWQVIGFAIVVGAIFAGATTRNGLKQGLCAGLLTASLYAGTQLANPKATLDVTLVACAVTLVLSIVGGMFGAALFPPILRRTKNAIPY